MDSTKSNLYGGFLAHIVAIGIAWPGATCLADEICPPNSSGPEICVDWSLTGTPELGTHFDLDYSTDPAKPIVTLRAAATWNVRSDSNGGTGVPDDIGEIRIDPTVTTGVFGLSIFETYGGSNAGAKTVDAITLTHGSFTGESSITGGEITALSGDLTVVEDGGSGGTINLTIKTDFGSTTTSPTMTIAKLGSNDQLTISGVTYGTVTISGDSDGPVTLNEVAGSFTLSGESTEPVKITKVAGKKGPLTGSETCDDFSEGSVKLGTISGSLQIAGDVLGDLTIGTFNHSATHDANDSTGESEDLWQVGEVGPCSVISLFRNTTSPAIGGPPSGLISQRFVASTGERFYGTMKMYNHWDDDSTTGSHYLQIGGILEGTIDFLGHNIEEGQFATNSGATATGKIDNVGTVKTQIDLCNTLGVPSGVFDGLVEVDKLTGTSSCIEWDPPCEIGVNAVMDVSTLEYGGCIFESQGGGASNYPIKGKINVDYVLSGSGIQTRSSLASTGEINIHNELIDCVSGIVVASTNPTAINHGKIFVAHMHESVIDVRSPSSDDMDIIVNSMQSDVMDCWDTHIKTDDYDGEILIYDDFVGRGVIEVVGELGANGLIFVDGKLDGSIRIDNGTVAGSLVEIDGAVDTNGTIDVNDVVGGNADANGDIHVGVSAPYPIPTPFVDHKGCISIHTNAVGSGDLNGTITVAGCQADDVTINVEGAVNGSIVLHQLGCKPQVSTVVGACP